ncbi:MAG: glycosyltransferase [Methanosarcinales archaeon]|nr:MAG: glycosyltransferase [Methanosarcinales archaeon]
MSDLSIKRIAFLYTRVSGYTSACLKALKEIYSVKILLYRWPESGNAPFNKKLVDFADINHIRNNQRSAEVINALEQFNPQAIYISGWTDKGYMKAARNFKRQGVPVVSGMDRQWNGALRQRIACLIARWYLHPAIDVLWVPGERQRAFAKKLGYTGNRCWSGMYACDWEKFASVKKKGSENHPPFFLYVGRYVDVKGIDLLVMAYKYYREKVENPWPLVCAGTGPQKSLLQNQVGIEDRGFIQPNNLPDLMGEAAAFVLPSRKEPWGVVVQEAAASGLPIICSKASGAGVHLVQDGYNGFVVENGNTDHLAEKMIQLHSLSAEQLTLWGERSHELSRQFTPQRWAETLISGIETW